LVNSNYKFSQTAVKVSQLGCTLGWGNVWGKGGFSGRLMSKGRGNDRILCRITRIHAAVM